MRPHAFLSRQPYIRHAICERVAAGERLAAICAEPGAPTYGAIYKWRRQDPEFAARLAAALTTAAQRRRFPFDEAKAAEILRRMWAGVSLQAILADPEMPTKRCLLNWRRSQIHFGEEVLLLRRRQLGYNLALHRPGRRPFDPVVAERIALALARGATLKSLQASDPQVPCRKVLNRWRAERPEFGAELSALLRLGPRVRSVLRAKAMAPKVAGLIRLGGTMRRIGAAPSMPCKETLGTWARRGGDFAEAVREAREERDDRLADAILAIAEGPGELAEKKRQMAALRRRMVRGGRAGL